MSNTIRNNWNRLKERITHWFRRCNGADNLGLAIIIAALIATILGHILQWGLLSLLGMGLYAWSLFRMLSHNKAKRMAENGRFTAWWLKTKREISQAIVRLKNIRKYKYYKCPNCKARLRMPRGIGEKTVTCSQCRHTFQQKA